MAVAQKYIISGSTPARRGVCRVSLGILLFDGGSGELEVLSSSERVGKFLPSKEVFVA